MRRSTWCATTKRRLRKSSAASTWHRGSGHMGKFEFTAIAADGATVTGVESGADTMVVRKLLREKSLQPVKIEAKKSILQLEITKKKVPRKELMHFSRQMAVFLRAGIPILDALIVISEETGNKLFKATLEDMADSLRSGGTFAGAAAEHPEAFPDFYLGILKSAELTGNLDTVLDQLAEYIDRDLEARRKIVSALVYPAVVMVMSVVTVIVLTVFVMPRFENFFKNLDAKLPLPTRMLLSTTNFLGNWWFVFLILFLLAAMVIGFGVRTEKGKEIR